MSGGSVLRFSGVGKRFGQGGAEVLSGVDLNARRGDFISLIGPSGCGKSTMLRLASGLTEPSSGTVVIGEGGAANSRSGVAHIFQDATLLPWLTVWENIEAPLAIRGAPAAERRRTVERMLEMVRLSNVAASLPRQLSGGMKMRVSVARALGQSPDVLLLDEPFGALDEITRNHLNEELLALRARQEWTALFVTHSVSEAVFLSNRVVVMGTSPGRILSEVAVPFDYPRTTELRESPDYQALVVRISRALRSAEGGAA